MNSSNKFGSINQNFDKHIDDKNSSVDLKDPDIILDFSAVNYIDTNGVKMIQQIIEDFKKCNVFVYICQSQGNK
jgi:anti-anti-sigma regulatory factor